MPIQYPEVLVPVIQRANALKNELRSASDRELAQRTLGLRAELRRAAAAMYERDAVDVPIQGGVTTAIDDLFWNFFQERFDDETIATVCALIREHSFRRLSLEHFDVQLAGGICMYRQQVVQMQNGEGKTLVIPVTAILHALRVSMENGIRGPHEPDYRNKAIFIATSNDYLARRDYAWMRPLYEAFGLHSACIDNDADADARRVAYAADIVYGTLSEFTFDYLRDHVATTPEGVTQPRRHCLMVDEIDHAFIDEARTPHILSAQNPVKTHERELIHLFNELAERLVANPGLVGREGKRLVLTEWGELIVTQGLRETATDGIGCGMLPVEFLAWLTSAQHELLGMIDEEAALVRPRLENAWLMRGPEGAIALTKEGKRSLENAVERLLGNTGRDRFTYRALLRILSGVIRQRGTMLSSLNITPDELFELKKVLSPTSLVRLPKMLSIVPVEGYLNALAGALSSETARRELLTGTRLVAELLLRSDNLEGDARLTMGGIRGGGVSQEAQRDRIGAMMRYIDAYLLAPFSRVALEGIEGTNVTLLRLFSIIIEIISGVMVGQTSRDQSERETLKQMETLRAALRNAVYQYDPDTYRVWLLPGGRSVLEHFVQELDDLGLWPLEARDDEQAVQQRLAHAQALLLTALRAHYFFKPDEDYVRDGREIQIVSEYTGRVLSGRRWSHWLHSFVEAKEGLEPREENITSGTTSIQGYARLFRWVSGLSATVVETAKEFREIYGLEVVEILPHKHKIHFLCTKPKLHPYHHDVVWYLPDDSVLGDAASRFLDYSGQGSVAIVANRRDIIDAVKEQFALHGITQDLHEGEARNRLDEDDLVFMTRAEVMTEAIRQTIAAHRYGQPVLVEAPSITFCETFAAKLQEAMRAKQIDSPIAMLNARAKYAHAEAEIIGNAGREGSILVATQMAGRGTDISVTNEALRAGGLLVIGLERRESRRWDNQIQGRAGRQGEPGTSRFILAIEGDLMRTACGARLTRMMERVGMDENVAIEHRMVTNAIKRAQRTLEENHGRERSALNAFDGVVAATRNRVYGLREVCLATRHPCLSRHHIPRLDFDRRKDGTVAIDDPSFFCNACGDAEKEMPTPRHQLVRPFVRQLFQGAAHFCCLASSYHRYLVERYTDESTHPSSWDWTGLLHTIENELGIDGVTQSYFTVTTWDRWVNKFRSLRFLPRFLKGVDDGMWRHKVEDKFGVPISTQRAKLEHRLRLLIAADRAQRVLNAVERKVKMGEAPVMYAGLAQFFAAQKVPQAIELFPWLDGDRTWAVVLSTIESMQPGTFHEVFVVLRPTVGRGAYPLIEALVPRGTTIADGTAYEVRSDVETALLVGYDAALTEDKSKAKTFLRENALLLGALDRHWMRFLNEDVETLESEAWDLEATTRAANFEAIMRRHEENLLGRIAFDFSRALMRSEEKRQKLTPAQRLSPRLLAEQSCICGKAAPFYACCASGAFAIRKPAGIDATLL